MIRLICSIGLGLIDFPHVMKEAFVALSGAHFSTKGVGKGGFSSFCVRLISGRHASVGKTGRDLQTAVEWSLVEGESFSGFGRRQMIPYRLDLQM